MFFMTNSFLATCSMIREEFENYVRQAVTFIVNALPQGHYEALSYFLYNGLRYALGFLPYFLF